MDSWLDYVQLVIAVLVCVFAFLTRRHIHRLVDENKELKIKHNKIETKMAYLVADLRPCTKHGKVAAGSIHACVACADEEVEYQMERAQKSEDKAESYFKKWDQERTRRG